MAIKLIANNSKEAEPEDPVYGDTSLPRKFNIGIAVPPHHDVTFSHTTLDPLRSWKTGLLPDTTFLSTAAPTFPCESSIRR